MSELLSPEQLQEVHEALQGSDTGESETVEAVEEVVPDTEVSTDSDAGTEAAFDEPSPESEIEETEDGHSVPYSRFSKVIAAKNRYAEEVSDLQAQIADMETRDEKYNQNIPQPVPEAAYSDEGDEYAHADNEEDYRFNALETQMREMAVQHEETKIESELAMAVEEFPTVDPEFLLNAVIEDPSVDMRELAEVFTNRVAEIEEAAVARYLETNPGAAVEGNDVPPEVAARSQGSQRGVLKQGDKPKTMAEAHSALEQWLEAQ